MQHTPEMDKNFLIYHSILDFLSESSDDYFFLLDMTAGKLYFPNKLKSYYALMEDNAEYCTLEEWYNIIYPLDLPAVQKDLTQVQTGKQTTHDLDYRIINRAGSIVWINCRGKVYISTDGTPQWMIGRVSESLPEKADRLTGAFNMEALKEEIEKFLGNKQKGYLLLLDVDDQKSINLKYGQAFGDKVLKQVAEALEQATAGTRRIYRMDGDCFAVNLPGKSAYDVKNIFSELQSRLEGQCTLSGGSVPFHTYKVPDAGTLYQYAENSVDYAKAHGKNLLRFFSAEDYEKDLAVIELKEDLKRSIDHNFEGFSLHYQPQVHSHSYMLHGAEALLRYHSPRRGNVSPSEFIPILEETNMMRAVGMWVLDTALEQCRQWRLKIPEFCISINMSYTQLCDENITEKVLMSLARSGLPGTVLTIEITESIQLLNYSHLNEIFRRWKQCGIAISIDDFGTGYSSLGRLKDMEIDEIKIDRCFVSDIQHSAYNYRLLSNMIELADTSKIRVCCEGIETPEELATLEELRPNLLQGFLFSRPCDPQQFEEIYINTRSRAFQAREEHEDQYRHIVHNYDRVPISSWPENEVVQAIVNTSNDILYVSDLHTYELYYLNPVGQDLFGLRDYRGKKCYNVLQGRTSPCPFCTNKYLEENEFYIWDQLNEYCGRHFILKDKLLTYQGQKARLEVALDITAHEFTSKTIQEQLNFSKKVVEYTKLLSENSNYGMAIQDALSALGTFYNADRAYLFEPDAILENHWSNTYEWCRSGVSPEAENLQSVPPEVLDRWIQLFNQDKSVIIFNLDALQNLSPAEWSVLSPQDISRIIAVPMWLNDTLIGFIGIDNPRVSIQDDSQVRVMSHFLLSRIRQDRNQKRFEMLFDAGYGDIMNALNAGLWVLYLDRQQQNCRLLADDTMCRIMGLSESLTPQECYTFWYNRINAGYYHYVNKSIDCMVQTGKAVQLEYTWKHPHFGEVIVQCTGIRADDQDGSICLKGYHRIISDTACPCFLSDVQIHDVFEYNELEKTIFFHTDRRLLMGDAVREFPFPQCWIDQEIVHPHFASDFQRAFSQVSQKSDQILPEIMLKGKNGTYEWFKLTLRHLGTEQQDLNTIIVMLESAGLERIKELELMRIRRFYQVLLSEAIAYAEVDLESGQLQCIGGIWSVYQQDYRWQSAHFLDILEMHLAQYVPESELLHLQQYRDRKNWAALFQQGKHTHRLSYQRPINGQLRWVELAIHIFREEFTQNVYSLLYLKDITADKELSLAQAHAASRDPLTGIYNRAAFERKVSDHVLHSCSDPCGTLILLDVDNFKLINDNMGHLAGDHALKEISRILLSTFRQNDIIGRLGGDEFMIFMKDCVARDTISQRLQQFLHAINSNISISLTCSIGLVFVSSQDFDYNRSLEQADIALYRSKQNGKNQFLFFDDLPERSEC